MPEHRYSRHAYAAMLAAAEAEHDFADWLTFIVAAVTTRVGGIDELLQGRPGSWEAGHLRDWMASAGCEVPEFTEHYQQLATRLQHGRWGGDPT